jgi:UPF0755 protein
MEGNASLWTVASPKQGKRYLLAFVVFVIALTITATTAITILKKAPDDFPIATPITIPSGTSVAKTVRILKDAHVIRSEFLLYTILLTQYTPNDIKASTYVFDKPYDVFAIAKKLAAGDFINNLVRLTHREGESVKDLAHFVHTALPTIDEAEFTDKATPFEGKLFPETYFVPPYYTTDDIITKLTNTYEETMKVYRPDIASSSLSENDTIILASIVEREANSPDSMAMVAGILEHRLAIGMPLQADATLEYILNKPLSELTAADLELDSPYNTYKHKELPPTPIGNPGKAAIEAVIHPTPSDYLYYITDSEGTFHYATTYEDHKRNIARYLKK